MSKNGRERRRDGDLRHAGKNNGIIGRLSDIGRLEAAAGKVS